MKFDPPLQQGRFQKRYKRFFTDIEYHGDIITAHCPNTGSMKGLDKPNSTCLFSTTDDPKRKLKYTLQMVKTPSSWVGVNTGLPNKLVAELFNSNPLKHWQKFDSLQSEVKISEMSRIDLVLWNSSQHTVKKWNHKNLTPPLHLIEVKNVTLAEDGVALFPDAVTSRGLKHLHELIELREKGFSCEMVFVVQRTDCSLFKAAADVDPDYARGLKEAKKAGVKITPLPCKITKKEVALQATPMRYK
ncbi:MAG: DNA/RNA nuclease SfsA [Pseudomonadota bacterium]